MDFESETRPKHYSDYSVEPMDLIRAYGYTEGFCVGNVIKYVARYKDKDGLQDLYKAKWYLQSLIDYIEKEN